MEKFGVLKILRKIAKKYSKYNTNFANKAKKIQIKSLKHSYNGRQ